MEVLNQEHVRSELIQLTEKQVSTLEKRKFVVLTEAEFESRESVSRQQPPAAIARIARSECAP